MQISLKIVGEVFEYEYEIGKNREHGTMPLSARNMILFTQVLEQCQCSSARNTKEEMNEIRCMAYIEKHPELLKKYKKRRG